MAASLTWGPPVLAQEPTFRPDAWFLPDDPLLGFVEIPEGSFLMGSDPALDRAAFETERWSNFSAQGSVELPLFYIGRYEVTLAQFRAFVESTDYEVDEQTLVGSPDQPVAFVSWPDALAYGRWLEATLSEWPETPPLLRNLLLNGWKISLPSEAEWEKAARGSDGRVFPWGNAPRRDLANYSASGVVPVGTFQCAECTFGLSDMSGNVWEWTRSPYQPYPFTTEDDRDNLSDDALWVMRGGGFADEEQNVRAAVRGAADPGVRRDFIGFRLVIARF